LATREIAKRGQALVLAGRAGIPLIPEMNPLPSEAIFDKISMSAFEGTPLDMALRDCGIDAFAHHRHRHGDRHRTYGAAWR
jgi:nicotinamidase-related amidase